MMNGSHATTLTLQEAIASVPPSRRLHAWRILNGLDQAAAARRWGIHPGTLSTYERGTPPGRTAVRRVISDDTGIPHGEEWS